MDKQVDGILFNAIGEYSQRFESIRRAGMPLIVLGRSIKGFHTTCVTIDNFLGAYQAVRHLAGTGMKNITFLYGSMESSSAINDRFEGYQQALNDTGLAYDELLVAQGDWSIEGGAVATDDLISRNVKFDAVFASNDVMAIGCISKLLDCGVRVPEDISVMGYDDIPMAGIFRPHLSTVHSPLREFGIEAVKTILRIICSKKDNMSQISFKPELVLRQSIIQPLSDTAPQ